MKILFHTLLLFFVCGYAAAVTEKTDRERDGLLGPVQVVREETAKLSLKSGKWAEGDRVLISIKIYNAEGYMVKEGQLFQRRIKTYDAKGNLTEEARYKADGSLDWKLVYSHDGNGNLTEEARHVGDGKAVWKRIYTYDAKGNKTSSTTYEIVGSRAWQTEKHVYTYDNKGNLTVDASYYRDGSLNDKRTYVYDDMGKRAEEADYHDGSLSGKNTYAYDAKGNLTKKDYLTKEGDVSWVEVWKYDDKNNLIESASYDGKDSLEYKETRIYDVNGNLTEQAGYEADGSLQYKSGCIYEFDSIGNWGKRTLSTWVTKSGKSYFEPSGVTHRTIAYFGDSIEGKAEKLQAELLKIASHSPKKLTKEKPKPRIEVKLYADSSHSKELCFFDRSGATLSKSIYYAIRCTKNGSGTVSELSGGLYNPRGQLVHDLSGKSTDEQGWCRFSDIFQAEDMPGVWLFTVVYGTSDDSGVRISKNLHLYSGSGISSYGMDLTAATGGEEIILENRHLIAAFNGTRTSDRILVYLYQKDNNASYKFGKTNVGRFDSLQSRFEGSGEVTSDQAVEKCFSNNLDREGENLPTGSISCVVNLKHPHNELVMGTKGNKAGNDELWVWIRTSDGFAKAWEYTDDSIHNVWDVKVGDTDNDGDNEIVFFTEKHLMVFEHQAGKYVNVWNGPALGIMSAGQVADVDNDGVNEIVVRGLTTLYVLDYHDSDYRICFSDEIAGSFPGIGVGDFDKDGENEIATTGSMANAGDIIGSGTLRRLRYYGPTKVLIYEFDGTTYVNTTKIEEVNVGSAIDDLATGDFDGDGFPEIMVCGNGKKFQVIGWTGERYGTKYLSDTYLRYVQSCAFGDANNDGRVDTLASQHTLKFFENRGGSILNTWNSETDNPNHNFGMHILTIADTDSDGLNEIVCEKPGWPVREMAVWGDKENGSGFQEIWAHRLPEQRHLSYVAVGDCDNSGSRTRLSTKITLPTEDADWLEYRVHNMKVDTNISSVFSIMSGSIGLGKDDRYHLENGSDNLITNLKSNTWNNFQSNYCIIHDNSDRKDSVNNSVIAWVRFKESENVKFDGVGLWNDTNGNASSRIRYNIKDSTEKDSLCYLLVFSKGGPEIIDHWLPGIRVGRLPESNFMTRTNVSAKDTVVSEP